jgi:LysM repeat protein
MSFFGKSILGVAVAAVLVTTSGCSLSDSDSMDDEKEPHFVEGKSCVNSKNYSGAVEAFQEALDVNPRSAAAHYQLGILYDQQVPDPAAAIYHYQQYLKLDANARNPEVIQQRIESCKQQLAGDVLQPTTPAAQKQLDKIIEQNRQLQQQVDALKQWNAYYVNQLAAQKTNPPPVQNNYVPPTPATSPTPDDVTVPSPSPAPAPTIVSASKPKPLPAKPIAKPRTHVVASGETLAAIARKLGISLTALEAANPDVNPKKLRAGQTLNLPP